MANNKMALVSPYISIITLNINGLNSPIKKAHSGWLDLKNKTQLDGAYRRLISALRTHIGSKRRDGKRNSRHVETKRKQR